MKRLLSAMIALVLLLAIPIASVEAAGDAELGEMLISSEKQSVAVGDVVKVNFELYPNLPDGRKLDSLSGSMKFDTDFLSFGTINQVDEQNNLTSLIKGKASSFQYKFDEKTGTIRFAFIDAYGVDAEGFWFQAEFRVEKEGSTDFVFNGISYTGVDNQYQTVSFRLDPVSVGGLYTEGESVPTDGAAEETFAPLTPAVNTPVPVTPTPKPSNSGQSVPVTSTLPTYSAKPSDSTTVVTPAAAVTSMPVITPGTASGTAKATESASAVQTDTPAPAVPDATSSSGTDPQAEVPDATDSPSGIVDIEPTETAAPTTPDKPIQDSADDNPAQQTNMLLVIGVIIGIVAVIGLGALAIILVLKRRNMEE